MNSQYGDAFFLGHVDRAGCSPKAGTFHGDEEAAAFYHSPVPLVEGCPTAFAGSRHMDIVRRLAHRLAGGLLFVVTGKGQDDL